MDYRAAIQKDQCEGPRAALLAFLAKYYKGQPVEECAEEALQAAQEFAEDQSIPFDPDLIRSLYGKMMHSDDWASSAWISSGIC